MGIYDRDWYRDSIKKQQVKDDLRLKSTSKRLTPIFIFLVIVFLAYILFHNLGYASYPGNTMSNKHAYYLIEIDKYFEDIRIPLGTISEQHKLQYHERNIAQYREVLLQGITACDQAMTGLETAKYPGQFVELNYIAKDFVYNTHMALKHYLEHTYSNNHSDIVIGNNYLEKSNANMKDYHAKLVQFLDKNKLKYEIHDDGQLRYWYKGELFNIPT